MRLDDDLSEVTDSVSLRSDSSATASAAAAATPPTATCECDPDPTRTHARPHSHVHTMQQHSQRHGVGALVDTRRAPFPPPRADADTSASAATAGAMEVEARTSATSEHNHVPACTCGGGGVLCCSGLFSSSSPPSNSLCPRPRPIHIGCAPPIAHHTACTAPPGPRISVGDAWKGGRAVDMCRRCIGVLWEAHLEDVLSDASLFSGRARPPADVKAEIMATPFPPTATHTQMTSAPVRAPPGRWRWKRHLLQRWVSTLPVHPVCPHPFCSLVLCQPVPPAPVRVSSRPRSVHVGCAPPIMQPAPHATACTARGGGGRHSIALFCAAILGNALCCAALHDHCAALHCAALVNTVLLWGGLVQRSCLSVSSERVRLRNALEQRTLLLVASAASSTRRRRRAATHADRSAAAAASRGRFGWARGAIVQQGRKAMSLRPHG